MQLSHPLPLLPATGKRLSGFRGLRAFCLCGPSEAGWSSGEVLALLVTESGEAPKSRELPLEDERKVGADDAGSRCAASRSPTLDDMDAG